MRGMPEFMKQEIINERTVDTMEKLSITYEEFQQVQKWINGEESSLADEAVRDIIMSLITGFRRTFSAKHPGLPVPRFRMSANSSLSLGSLLSDLKDDSSAGIVSEINALVQEADLEIVSISDSEGDVVRIGKAQDVQKTEHDGTSEETDKSSEDFLDSVLLIDSIAFVAEEAGTILTKSKAQLILYCLYGTMLASGKGLPTERPQMWRYGPVFPRAYKNSHLGQREYCELAWNSLQSMYPDMARILSGKTYSMMNTPMFDLDAVHKGSHSPYGKLLKGNPGKWGMQIPDESIREFFAQNVIS